MNTQTQMRENRTVFLKVDSLLAKTSDQKILELRAKLWFWMAVAAAGWIAFFALSLVKYDRD